MPASADAREKVRAHKAVEPIIPRPVVLFEQLKRGGELATAMSAAAEAVRTGNPVRMMGTLQLAESAADDLVRRL
jgi:hypothetical protein